MYNFRLTVLVCTFALAVALAHTHVPGKDGPSLTPTHMLRRAQYEFALAAGADKEAAQSAQAVVGAREELTAYKQEAVVEDALTRAASLTPDALAAVTAARGFATEAQQHARHAMEALRRVEAAPQMAAKEARLAVERQAHADAVQERNRTEAAAAARTQDPVKVLAENVGAAMEPYHMASLRAEASEQRSYEKAKGEFSEAQDLSSKAKQQALDAQALQSAGSTERAGWLMERAKEMMQRARDLKSKSTVDYEAAVKTRSSLDELKKNMLDAGKSMASRLAPKVYIPWAELPLEHT